MPARSHLRRATVAVAAVGLSVAATACGAASTSTSTTATATSAPVTSSSTTSSSTTATTKRRRAPASSTSTTTVTSRSTTVTSRSTTVAPTTTTRTTTTRAPAPPKPPAPVFTPPVHAVLVGQNHTPTVNAPWTYTVTVTDARGRKLSGTETTQYTFNGTVVGTEKPENVRFTHGVYHDTIEFPPAAAGHPLHVRAVVHTSIGMATVDWPIVVHK